MYAEQPVKSSSFNRRSVVKRTALNLCVAAVSMVALGMPANAQWKSAKPAESSKAETEVVPASHNAPPAIPANARPLEANVRSPVVADGSGPAWHAKGSIPLAPPVDAETQLPKTAEPIGQPRTSEPVPNEPGSARHPLYDSVHSCEGYGIHSLFDSLHPADAKGKHWYEKYSVRGYTQLRLGRTVLENQAGAEPFMTTDRSINGNQEDFSIRRARFIFSGDVSKHLAVYAQLDLANTLPGVTNTFFDQIRDLYGDVYVDEEKVHRFRVGVSKVPFGFDNMQSSQNRLPLDRSDAINSVTSFNERDLGVFYYWTPQGKQQLFKDLVDGGLKGSGNYGIFGIGVYNGQSLGQIEQNMNLHTVARLTYPFQLPSGQAVEASIQGYTGYFVVAGAAIRPLGTGSATTPLGTGGTRGIREQRLGGTFVWYPQPFGIQAEWNVGKGPGLNVAQTEVKVRSLHGGYVTAMYKIDTEQCGIVTPYVRWQYYEGGYKGYANTPYGTHNQLDVGAEWQIRKEMELVIEYSQVDGVNPNAFNTAGVMSYRNFDGGVLRAQFQINY